PPAFAAHGGDDVGRQRAGARALSCLQLPIVETIECGELLLLEILSAPPMLEQLRFRADMRKPQAIAVRGGEAPRELEIRALIEADRIHVPIQPRQRAARDARDR